MKNSDIILAAARAVQASEAVRSECVASYGRGLQVICETYPSAIPEAKDAPFLLLTPADGDQSGRVKSDYTFSVVCILGVCPLGENGERLVKTTEHDRTEAANGLVVYGKKGSVDGLRDAIIATIRNAGAGAIVEEISTDEETLVQLPLEWTVFTVKYREYAALSNN